MIIRRATAGDATAVAAISTGARHVAMPSIRWAHTAEEDRWWVANVLLAKDEVWVAEDAADEGGGILGFLALHDDAQGGWVSQLYLRPDCWRRGIGSALIVHAKARRPGGLRLWCFQVNAPARAFYARHGFAISHFTDGADNEEQEPDMLFVWPGATP